MTNHSFDSLDFARADQPEPTGDPREDLLAWLAYQRHEFLRKLRDLSVDQLVEWSVPPVQLSVLGLVRHMRQMEHVHLVWGLGGGEQTEYYGEDDYAGGSAATFKDDLQGYFAEVSRADAAIAALPTYDAPGLGHGRPLGYTLIKILHEYTLHSGQAHMLRFAALGDLRR
ncbi:mycothiol transferase [Agromyces albus]|uniref:mycothiol transferase n=1 Tax=Agromyces albus TaxID=205332 RepID=UPI00277E2A53|nr:DUF664 domain-containing protein [Agromyces albus]MDQ0577184.1 hypothetical protein [Agromyces albus]